MVLNFIWLAFFLIAFLTALSKLIFLGDMAVFSEMVKSLFSMSKTAFEISLGLTGVLAFWLGIMKVGEKGGMVQILSKIVRPFFSRLFPEIPKDHPVYGSIMMNFAANMLGLDNAATPMGLKAMEQLQELNPNKDTASDSQILFLVLNTSGLTLIPISVMVYRAQLGAANPADVFLPILLATFFSTLTGLFVTSFFQKINLFNRVVLSWIGSAIVIATGLIYWLSSLPKDTVSSVSSTASSLILFSVILAFLGLAAFKRINVYETFIEGAKEGFSVAVRIIPYLIAILVAIAVFRSSGAMQYFIDAIRWLVQSLGFSGNFVDSLPTALMKPLSGSGARGMMVDAMKTFGADSFTGRLASTLQGATDTTFYILAVYFGSVGIKKTRHAVAAGLAADLAGIAAAILLANLFFG